MINAMSVDVENWWMNEIVYEKEPQHSEILVNMQMEVILDLFRKYDAKATFFVLGSVARDNPDLLEKMYDEGHEIATHGYSHTNLNKLTTESFEKEIVDSKDALKKYDPVGFRAPYFSINNNTKWAFPILKKHGFRYDSSVFPIINPYYGVKHAPIGIYHPSSKDVGKDDPGQDFVEFPMSVYRIMGYNMPISGGFYLRAIPVGIIKQAIKGINKTRPYILYFHPCEIDTKTPYVPNMSSKSKFIAYYGKSRFIKKLTILLKNFKWGSIKEIIGS